MAVYAGEALILRTYELAEADRIVVFLTRERGKRRGVAKGARRSRSRFRAALEPLTLATVEYFEKEQRQLVRLNYVEAQRSPLAIQNPEAMGYVGYFAELLDEWSADSDPSERMFRLAASIIEALASQPDVEPVARYFEFWLLRLQGVYPAISACHRCGASLGDGARLTPDDRMLVCLGCGRVSGGLPMSGEAIEFLRRARTSSPERMGDVPLIAPARRELEMAHAALIATHLERELRSTRVLRELRDPTGPHR